MKVYIRDDDLGYTYDSLEEYLQVFVDENVPLNLQAIPARIYQNRQLAKIIKPFLKTGLFEIHQHGISHLPMSAWGELDDRKDLEKALKVGKDVLIEYFGEHFKPYFTAPWEKIHPAIEDYIKKEYKGISPDNLPIHINLRIRDDKGPRWKTIEELKKEFELLRGSEKIGILLHHYLYENATEHLETLREFIQYLKKEGCEVVKFSEL